MKRIVVAAVMGAVMMLGLGAQPPKHEHGGATPAQSPAASAFEKLKALAGRWEGQAAHGTESFPGTATYRVSGAGSAVVETLFPGSEHEMETVYVLSGDAIEMTHYCAMGNQPRMRAKPGAGATTLEFECIGVGNCPSDDAPAMRSLKMTLDGDDHLAAEWGMYEGGKQTETARFDLKRVKAGDGEFDTWYVITLKHGSSWTSEVTPEVETMQKAHLANIDALKARGVLKLAGPFADRSGGMMVVQASSAEDAVGLLKDDPAVQSGRLVPDVRPWMVRRGDIR